MGFATGILIGVDRGLQRKRQDERDAEHDQLLKDREARDKQKFESDQADVALKRSDQQGLRDAAAPAKVTQAGALPEGLQFASNEDADAGTTMPAMPGFRVETGQGAQRYDTQQQADTAAAAHNDPVALNQRLTSTLMQQGKPLEALKLSEEADKYATQHWQEKLGTAIQGGHDGLAELVSNSEAGPFKGRKLKVVTSPDGKTVNYNLVGDDGTLTPTKLEFPAGPEGAVLAGFMLDKSVKPHDRYKLTVENDRKESLLKHQKEVLDQRQWYLENVTGPAAKTRLALAEAKAGDAENPNSPQNTRARETERKRLTGLQREAGRQLSDVGRQIAARQRDSLFMMRAAKPDSDEAAQMQEMRDTLKSHKEDFDFYGSQLNDLGQTTGPAAAATAPGGASPGPKVAPSVQRGRDGETAQILQQELEKTQAALAAATKPEEKQRLQQDLEGIQRELGRTTTKAGGKPAGKPAAKGGAQELPKDKALLQKGTTYNTKRGPATWNGTAFEAK